MKKIILSLFLLVPFAQTDEIKFNLKIQVFSNRQHTNAHYLTIENQEFSRETIEDALESARKYPKERFKKFNLNQIY